MSNTFRIILLFSAMATLAVVGVTGFFWAANEFNTPLPTNTLAPTKPGIDPNILHQTQVAEQVNAIMSATAAQQTAQALAATDTPAPTDTPPPTDTPTEIPPTATHTPLPTNTAAPTATPTLDKKDPKKSLGAPTFKDNFSGTKNFYTYDSKTSKAEVKDDQFVYTLFDPQSFSEWTLSWMNVKDFYAEVEATTPNQCQAKDRYGLMFHAPDPNHGYLFSVTCDGEYRLAKWDGQNFDILIDYTKFDDIYTGPNQTNRIGVKMIGNSISLYINGKYATTITDDTYLAAARFGFIIGSENTEDFAIKFDNFAYWELD